MNKFLVLVFLLASSLGFAKGKSKNKKHCKYDKVVGLSTMADTIGYILGVQLGGDIGKNTIDKPSINGLNLGFSDAYNKKDSLLVPKSLFQPILQNYFNEQQALIAKNKLNANKLFLDENGKRQGVVTTPSGLQYEIVTLGTGEKPKETDIVKVFYNGTHLDGSTFDGNMGEEPITFPLNQVILGWTEGVQLMPIGSTFKFYIPPHLAYGEQGSPPVIAPNEVLIFDVQLLGIEKPTENKSEN